MHLTFQEDGEVGWDSGGRGWGRYQGLPGEEADSAGDWGRPDHGDYQIIAVNTGIKYSTPQNVNNT